MTHNLFLFILTKENHLRIVNPVARRFLEDGHKVHFLSLDKYYQEGASEALDNTNFSWTELPGDNLTSNWWDLNESTQRVLIEKIKSFLPGYYHSLSPRCIIICNTGDAVEQVCFDVAIEEEIPVTFLQDGRITAPRFRQNNLRKGCDLYCVWGENVEIQTKELERWGKVVATGAPRHDVLHCLDNYMPHDGPYTVLLAAQSFSRYHTLSPEKSISTYRNIISLLLERLDVGKLSLKPHPQTIIWDRFVDLSREFDSRVEFVEEIDSLSVLQKTDCVISVVSTMLIEASLLKIPIVQLDYLMHPEAQSYATKHAKFLEYIQGSNFPSNFFTEEGHTEEYISGWSVPVDGQATNRVVSEIYNLIF